MSARTVPRRLLPAPDLWRPEDHNVKAWTWPPILGEQAGDARLDASGQVVLQRIKLEHDMRVSQFVMYNFRTGSGLTANQNYMGLYTLAANGTEFTRRAVSADLSTVWTTGGVKVINFSGGNVDLTEESCWVAYLSNGTTRPAPWGYEMASGMTEAGLDDTVAHKLRGTSVTAATSGQTSLAATYSVDGSSFNRFHWWAAIR